MHDHSMRKVCLILGFLLLSACVRRGSLPPEDVLARAAGRNAAIESFAFQGTLRLAMSRPGETLLPLVGNILFEVVGVSQSRGRQTQATVSFQGTLESADTSHAVAGRFETFTEQQGAVFLRVSDVAVSPPHPLLRDDALAAIRGATWWMLPGSATGAAISQVSPDPGLLQMQTNVITVSRDRGLVTVDGHEAYHYDVSVDPGKLSQYLRRAAEAQGRPIDDASLDLFVRSFTAEGQIWIDADTFDVLRTLWNVEPASEGFSVRADLTIKQHNAAPRIRPPEDPKQLPAGLIPGSSTSVSPALPENPDTLSP